MEWKGRKVFLKTFGDRIYNGVVLDENTTKLTIKDKYGNLVELSKIDIKICQEEK